MFRLIHILGAIMFLGGIIADLFWMKLAERTRKPSALAFASKTVTVSDFLIAIPGGGLLLLSGIAILLIDIKGFELGLSATINEIFRLSWLVVSLILFNFSGIIWMFLILPNQRRMALISAEHIDSEVLPEAFFQLLRKWYSWGLVATAAPLIALVLMVLRPHFWQTRE